ncbi:MAG: glycosyltransferase [Clostridium sp.]|nr:glycosyltransferase [Clostridium sp.]
MKVLQVNCFYGEGSTGKITRDIHQYLQAQGCESVVCYGRGANTQDPGVIRICSNLYGKANNLLSRITGLMYGGCLLSTRRLIRIIRREKPDVVHLQCINGYFVNIYRLITWLKEQGMKTVLTLHAEFMYTANCGHALDCDRWLTGCGRCPRCRQETKSLFFDGTARSFRKMQRAFAGFEDHLSVVSVSPWLKNRAEQSPILAGKKHCVIFNGVDTETFHPY